MKNTITRTSPILWVDDKDDIIELAKSYFKGRLPNDYQILTAKSKVQALEIFESNIDNLSAIILDIELTTNDTDGIELFENFRKTALFVPICFYSAPRKLGRHGGQLERLEEKYFEGLQLFKKGQRSDAITTIERVTKFITNALDGESVFKKDSRYYKSIDFFMSLPKEAQKVIMQRVAKKYENSLSNYFNSRHNDALCLFTIGDDQQIKLLENARDASIKALEYNKVDRPVFYCLNNKPGIYKLKSSLEGQLQQYYRRIRVTRIKVDIDMSISNIHSLPHSLQGFLAQKINAVPKDYVGPRAFKAGEHIFKLSFEDATETEAKQKVAGLKAETSLLLTRSRHSLLRFEFNSKSNNVSLDLMDLNAVYTFLKNTNSVFFQVMLASAVVDKAISESSELKPQSLELINDILKLLSFDAQIVAKKKLFRHSLRLGRTSDSPDALYRRLDFPMVKTIHDIYRGVVKRTDLQSDSMVVELTNINNQQDEHRREFSLSKLASKFISEPNVSFEYTIYAGPNDDPSIHLSPS